MYPLRTTSAQSLDPWLVVAVTSRLANVQHRKAVRSTWKNSLPNFVLFKFILSDTSCDIDPLWRLDPDVCAPWELSMPNWIQDGTPIVPFSSESSTKEYQSYTGIVFKIKTFPILLHSIGISTNVIRSLPSNSSISLVLKNRSIGKAVMNVSFSANDKLGSSFAYKSSGPKGLELAPGFEGWLYFERQWVELPEKCSATLQAQLGKHGVLIITGLKENRTFHFPYTEESCPLVNLEYSLIDPTDIKQHIGARETRNKVEERKMKEIEKDIHEEMEDHDDLVFMPSKDDQPSASKNIKNFLSVLSEEVSYDYVLVTPDSSLVNIDSVLSNLDGFNSWWSSFQFFAKRQERDLKYFSTTYPPMLRAKSFVISRHLAEFIGTNKEYLEDFSTLPVSVSIWMSVLNTKIVNDDRWLGGPEVVNRTQLWRDGKIIVLEDMSTEDMERAWRD